MKIDEIQSQLVDELTSAENNIKWINLLDNTTPGHFGVEDVEVDIASQDIWVNIPKLTFTFSGAYLSFSARLGGSSDRNGYDESFSRPVSGSGEFNFKNRGKGILVSEFNINEEIELF